MFQKYSGCAKVITEFKCAVSSKNQIKQSISLFQMAYVLVQFLTDASTSIVPTSWIENAQSNDATSKCFVAFPPKSIWSKMRSMVQRQAPPSAVWESFEADILLRGGKKPFLLW